MEVMYQLLQDQSFRLLLSVIFLIPLSWFMRHIDSTKSRRIYSLTLGTLLQVLVFKPLPILKIFVFSTAMYYVVKFQPKNCGKYVTIASMVFLSYYHLYSLLLRYGQNTMDEGVLVMIMVCKYSLFAYAYQDARNPEKLTKEQQKFMIKENVSLIQYYQYLQFLPTSTIGPPIQYSTFKNYINKTGPYEKIPSISKPLQQNFIDFITCATIYGLTNKYLPTEYLLNPQFYTHSIFYIAVYTYLTITGLRFKYFSAWKLSMFSVHISGLSYSKENDNFKNVNHCNVLVIELSPHLRDKVNNWNIMVQEWLRKCVYQRSPFKSRGKSQLLVFMVSAFWHGYYLGYYISFFMWFVQIYLQGKIYKFFNSHQKLSQIYSKPPIFLKALGVILANWFFTFNATFFYLLDWNQCYKFMSKVYFIPELAIIVLAIILKFLPIKKLTSSGKRD